MCWPLWTSLVVAMHDNTENTSVGIDHVISHISVNCITNGGKASTMLQTCIGAGHRNASKLILIMEWPNIA